MKKSIIATIILTLSVNAFSKTSPHVGRGFSWYETKEKPVKKKDVQQEAMNKTISSPLSQPQEAMSKTAKTESKTPAEELDDYHKKHANLLAEWSLRPTKESAYELMVFQQEAMKLSRKATDAWKQNLMLHPELNHEAKHPTEKMAIHAYDRDTEAKENAVVSEYAKNGYGLFYVYGKDDVYGTKYGEHVQLFADSYEMPLLGISTDGVFNEHIRKNRVNNGKLNVKFTPVVLLVNMKDVNDIKVVSYGVTSGGDLRRQINFIHNGYKTEY